MNARVGHSSAAHWPVPRWVLAKLIGLVAGAVLVPATLALAAPASTAIEWKGEGLVAAAGRPLGSSGASEGAGPRHVVLQFDEVPGPEERKALAYDGVHLLRYLGSKAFFAFLDDGGADVHAPVAAGVRSAWEIEPGWKLHPALLGGEIPSYAHFYAPGSADGLSSSTAGGETAIETVALYVLFHPDVGLETDGARTVERHGGAIRDTMPSINGAVVWLPLASLWALAAEDAVQWMEPPLPPLEGTNDSNRVVTEADIVNAGPYDLDGSGVNVLVYDGGTALASHPDFGGRLSVRDGSGSSSHATHVAGTIGGDGTSSAAAGGSPNQWRGMAPGVVIQSYAFRHDGSGTFLYTNPGDLEADYDEAINVYGAEIANNSIGTNTAKNGFPCEFEGDYGATSMLIDAIVGGSLGAPMRIVWANGNERGVARCGTMFHTTAPPACAKNHITVGALNSDTDTVTSFSSWGPTDDGRLKPDVSAPGCQASDDFGVTSTVKPEGYDSYCGTSMAAPTVTGLSALLLEDWQALFPGDPLPRNSMLKVLLAHNAKDRGIAGPDYKFGYGSVRIQDSIDFMRSGNFVEAAVDQGDTQVLVAFVPPGAPALKVTLAWDDPPGAVNTIPELVNDLDLLVTDPTGSTSHFPWTLDPANPGDAAVRTQSDRLNNIEQVVVDSPASGVWTIAVSGFSVPTGPQVFSLAASPDLLVCSSTGVVGFHRAVYTCDAAAQMSVNDCDLNAAPDVAEAVTVTVASGSEPGGESVLLTETSSNAATFAGTIALDTIDAAGILQVNHGDTLTATYEDADDGGGPATVQGTAAVDCVAPVATNVVTVNVTARTATVTLDTDEAAAAAVRYGTSCGSLTDNQAAIGMSTTHALGLRGLLPLTQYFFVVDVTDAAGNTRTDDNGGACYSFTMLEQQDYFTELFAAGDNDLDKQTLIFTPDGSGDFYAVCRLAATAFPVDPSGGMVLPLSDYDYEQVALTGGAEVSLYGTSYSSFYVGSNGFLTFTEGDWYWLESLDDHFDLPRIAALFDHLNPAAGGTVSWKQLADRVAVTFEGVPEFYTGGTNSFQIELFFDGAITLTYMKVTATDGLVGLSEGAGVPADFVESDVSAYGCPAGMVYLNRGKHTCADSVGISVVDGDLAGTGTLDLVVTTSGGDSETVSLVKAPAAKGRFAGSILTDPSAVVIEDGSLQVSDGETITAMYEDADDGSGSPATVQDTAAVDCVAPITSNVATINVAQTGATVTLDTDEAASIEVRYGTTCGNSSQNQAGVGLNTTHAIDLTGLLPLTQYFFVVDATDEAGNTSTDDNGGTCYSFTTPDYFTELFWEADNDLDNKTFTFTPDGSEGFYDACRAAATGFPTDPSGGTVLSLGDDDYAQVTLAAGAEVSLYGASYGSFYVGSNGYLTFTQGDGEWSESLANHFEQPRVSALFDDLDPRTTGTISWKQLAGRVAVTFEGVPEYIPAGANSFQVELFFDGRIAITYLYVTTVDGLAGLSEGTGVPAGFVESDLSLYRPCQAGPLPLDDFRCYKARDLKNPRFQAQDVSLVDQFANDGDFEVNKPYLMCNPTEKNGAGINRPEEHLVCYKIKGPRLRNALRPKIEVVNKLGTVQLEVKKPYLLCVPSAKTVLQ